MESHEEKLAIMIRQSKEREAKEAMKEKSKQLSVKARDNRRGGPLGIPDMPSAIGSMGAIGGMGAMGGGGGAMGSGDLGMGGLSLEPSTPTPYAKPVKKGTGMQLGKPKDRQGVDLMQQMADEGELLGPEVGVTPAAAKSGVGQNAPIQLVVDEKLTVTMSRDGGVQGMEVKGELRLLITDATYGRVAVPVKLGSNAGFQFKTHPNINKGLYQKSAVLGLADASRSFPLDTTLSVLKSAPPAHLPANPPAPILPSPTVHPRPLPPPRAPCPPGPLPRKVADAVFRREPRAAGDQLLAHIDGREQLRGECRVRARLAVGAP